MQKFVELTHSKTIRISSQKSTKLSKRQKQNTATSGIDRATNRVRANSMSYLLVKVAPYGYSLFVLRALVSTILGNLPITLSRTSLEPIEIKFWEIKLPF